MIQRVGLMNWKVKTDVPGLMVKQSFALPL